MKLKTLIFGLALVTSAFAQKVDWTQIKNKPPLVNTTNGQTGETVVTPNAYGDIIVKLAADLDFSNKNSTKPIKVGSLLPSTCTVGHFFFLQNAVAGRNLYACTATNVWSFQGTGASTVALMPSAVGMAGTLWVATDATSANTCSTGGGSGTPSICFSNGAVWLPLVPTSGGSGGTAATTLAALLDVTLTAPATGEFLMRSGSVWVNSRLFAGTGGCASVTGATIDFDVTCVTGRSLTYNAMSDHSGAKFKVPAVPFAGLPSPTASQGQLYFINDTSAATLCDATSIACISNGLVWLRVK